MSHPVLVHCLNGSGKSAVFLLVAAALAEIEIGHMPDLIPDLIQLGAQISQQRKGLLREKEHFKQAIQAVIFHARDILVKKGKLMKEPTEILSETKESRSEIGDLNTISCQLGFEIKPQTPMMHDESEKSESFKEVKSVKTGIFSNDLSKLADFSDNTGATESGKSPKKKITKQDFINNKGQINQPNSTDDPLSQLDPMWSLK